jgi:signal transduction histidine kinase
MATILLVDDRPENLRALEAVLEPLGHPLICAETGDKALAALLKEDIALILLDVMMPGLDGFQTAELIKQRERTRDIPIIFLTAINQAVEHHLRGYETGAVDYINKPFDAHILRSKVSVFLDLQEKRELLQRQAEELRKGLAERDRAQRALVRRTTELARSNTELDQFVQVASHDIREPLDTMAGFLEIIADRLPSVEDDVRLLLARAIAQVARMREAIDALLRSARSTEGLDTIEIVDFDKVLDQAIDDLEGLLAEHGAGVARTALPAVRGDFWRLVELVELLIEQALTQRRDEAPEIKIEASEGSKEHLFSVTDNGAGIDPRETARVFTVFGKAGSSRTGRGTDVRLATCRRIIEQHGGRIWLESQAARGTTVFFTLPPAES